MPKKRLSAVVVLLLLFGPAFAEGPLELGRPVTEDELTAWRETVKDVRPARCRVERLPNGGWVFTRPDGSPFRPVGIEYEPLAIYGGVMDWPRVERDLDRIRDGGFNTLTVWCLDFNASAGAGRRLTLEDMVKLAELAAARGLFIQFYLNIDRFTQWFPLATMADGSKHGFDIDYFDPGYRDFIRHFARRLAMAFYRLDNVSTIVIWEEKIGLDLESRGDRMIVHALFGSEPGRDSFARFLRQRHGRVRRMNKAWGTDYAGFAEAADKILGDFQQGVSRDDPRQHELLEFGLVMLADFARDFVEAYREVDPTMLFQCRNWDLFGPVRGLHPAYAFLDSFGINQYAHGHRGPDLTFREELMKAKLVSGIAGTAPYVGNFGFRTSAGDGGTHGLVPDDQVKADMACLSAALFSFLPELAGNSYFTYYYRGHEGPFGIVREPADAEPLPIWHSLKALHELMAGPGRDLAAADYPAPPRLHLFHGLDAVFDLQPTAWVEHMAHSWNFTELNVNYAVVTDTTPLDPESQPVVIADFHAYDRKLDADVVRRLVRFCRRGGVLVIGNGFGLRDRYLRGQPATAKLLKKLRGFDVSDVRRGSIRVHGLRGGALEIKDALHVELDAETFDPDRAEVLLTMEVDGREQPALIRRRYGRGTVYYFLFNPRRTEWWGDEPDKIDRPSLAVDEYLCDVVGIRHDRRFGNRGLEIADGRINVREKPIHYFIHRAAAERGEYADEYGEEDAYYSGGVITRDFLCFRGRRLQEQGWDVETSRPTTLAARRIANELRFFTTDPAELKIRYRDTEIARTTTAYRVESLTPDMGVGALE